MQTSGARFVIHKLCVSLSGLGADELSSGVNAGNGVNLVNLPLAQISCDVTIAAKFGGTRLLRVWRTDSLAAAAATLLIA